MSTLLHGHDYSRLGVRGIRGLFFDALESDVDGGWARQVGFYFKSDAAAETHRWLGQVSSMREWIGARLRKGMRIETFSITNVFYENTLQVPVLDMRRDKTGQLKVKSTRDFARSTNTHWDELAVALLALNPTCYDGVALYATNHSSGDSGTQSNLLTAADVPALNVVDTGAITIDEAMAIIMGVCPYFWTYLNDKGNPANQGAREFLFVLPVRLFVPFQAAINRIMVAQGGDNPLKKMRFVPMAVLEPRLTTQTVGYVFRMDAEQAAGIILQEEIPVEFDYLDESSEYARLEKHVLLMAEASRAAAPGQWRHTIKFTIS